MAAILLVDALSLVAPGRQKSKSKSKPENQNPPIDSTWWPLNRTSFRSLRALHRPFFLALWEHGAHLRKCDWPAELRLSYDKRSMKTFGLPLPAG